MFKKPAHLPANSVWHACCFLLTSCLVSMLLLAAMPSLYTLTFLLCWSSLSSHNRLTPSISSTKDMNTYCGYFRSLVGEGEVVTDNHSKIWEIPESNIIMV